MVLDLLTISEVSRRSGVAASALRFYEERGLIESERAGSGHRRFARAVLRRIAFIVFAQKIGLSLDEIAAALEREGPGLHDAVRAHLARVEEHLAAQSALRDRLVRILGALGDSAGPSAGQLIETIEVMTMHEQYYTPEQLEQLAARREALGEEGMRKAESDWAELIAAMEAEREQGTDPADPRVQALAGRWQEMIQAFTGGDPGITASLKRMYDEQGAEHASRGAMSPGLSDYVGKAMAARGL